MTESPLKLPNIVSRDEWLAARKELFAREKEATPRSFGIQRGDRTRRAA